ncbi:DUF1700 domain-containing protein [Treponema sp. OMZ 840]|uniref:DUF1700 domain-containing protein n=1 Tax=Treponema sp. OMZ 840 TaxID=244313 RepID=UPI003D92CD7C
MTKDEYLNLLRTELQALPHDEQEEAMSYYRNYFEDAGDDASVIEELGAPEKLGAYIRSNFACVPGKNPVRDGENSKGKPKTIRDNAGGINMLLLILLLTVTFPVWGPVVLGLLAAALGIIVAIIAVIFAGVIAAAALFVAGIVVVVTGISLFFSAPLIALLGLGAGLFLVGLALLCGIIFIRICTKILPPVMRGIVKVCSLPFRRKS